MAKPRSSRPVGVRLLHTVDAYLRKKQRGKGDLSKLIMEALSHRSACSTAHHDPWQAAADGGQSDTDCHAQ